MPFYVVRQEKIILDPDAAPPLSLRPSAWIADAVRRLPSMGLMLIRAQAVQPSLNTFNCMDLGVGCKQNRIGSNNALSISFPIFFCRIRSRSDNHRI